MITGLTVVYLLLLHHTQIQEHCLKSTNTVSISSNSLLPTEISNRIQVVVSGKDYDHSPHLDKK